MQDEEFHLRLAVPSLENAARSSWSCAGMAVARVVDPTRGCSSTTASGACADAMSCVRVTPCFATPKESCGCPPRRVSAPSPPLPALRRRRIVQLPATWSERSAQSRSRAAEIADYTATASHIAAREVDGHDHNEPAALFEVLPMDTSHRRSAGRGLSGGCPSAFRRLSSIGDMISARRGYVHTVL